MTLAEAQELFHALATGDPSVSGGEADRLLRGTPSLSATDRIGIYADMYLWRLADALREDYPKVAALLGEERFLSLARTYARAHPSDRADLGLFGRHLPAFLARHPALAHGRPDLPDLASLEWARSEVFFDAPAEPLAPDALATSTPEEFLSSRISLVPALRILLLDHDATAIWRRLEQGEAAGEPAPEPTAVVVWRSGFDVFHATVELDEALALEAAACGDPLEKVCAAFQRREEPAKAAFQAISSWLSEGWIAGVRPEAR